MWTRGFACVTLLAALAVTFGPSRAGEPPRPINVFDPEPPGQAGRQLQRVLTDVRFDGTPLDKAIGEIRDRAGLNLVVQWRVLESAGIERATPVTLQLSNVTVGEALTAVCEYVDPRDTQLEFEARANLIFLSSGEALSRGDVTRVYEVSDLVLMERQRRSALRPPRPSRNKPTTRPEPGSSEAAIDQTLYADDPVTYEEIIDGITELLSKTIATESWRDATGTVGKIHELSGRLMITQTEANHRRVEAVLHALRQGGAPPPPPPSTPPTTRPAGEGR